MGKFNTDFADRYFSPPQERTEMKKKFTITIADIEMNVVCDESPEAVEAIVGILDRKMREINLHARRCSKNEAALLCALDYCAENMKLTKEIAALKKENEALAAKNSDLEKKLEAPVQLQMDISTEDSLGEQNGNAETETKAKTVEETAKSSEPSARPAVPERKKSVKPQKRVRSMFDLISFDNE